MMLTPFLFWVVTYLSFFYGVVELKPLGLKLKDHFLQNRAIEALRRAVQHLKLLSEMLESGVVPEAPDWLKIRSFPEPWGKILFESVTELRSQGAPILPTLARMQKTLDEQAELILEGKVKSSQAFGQAILGIVLIPVFAGVLYFMLPGIEQQAQSFFVMVLFSLFLGALSFIWMVSMVDQARFGNIRFENRQWIVSVNVALERLMALIATGLPADLAYRKTIEELAKLDVTLAREWKPQVWDSEIQASTGTVTANESERLILNLGNEIRRTIQTSLLEGRGSMDRLESIHRTFLLDLKMRIGRELSLLPNRCLKPLFMLVFPAVMILLMGSMGLCFQGFLS
jgi:hypothetical protein